MRVVAGRLKGRIFASPRTKRTHPMSDRMRGALFNALGDIEGLTVLDAFAGTGAIAIESISRGARSAVAVERDKAAHQTLEQNIAALDCQNEIKAIRANVVSWSQFNPSQKFNIIICDPPYEEIQANTLQQLVAHLASSGVYVLSLPSDIAPVELEGLTLIKSKAHAGGSLHYYKQS